MSSQEPFRKACSRSGSSALSRMISPTSSEAVHSFDPRKLLQISIRALIYSFLCFEFSRYKVRLYNNCLRSNNYKFRSTTAFLFYIV